MEFDSSTTITDITKPTVADVNFDSVIDTVMMKSNFDSKHNDINLVSESVEMKADSDSAKLHLLKHLDYDRIGGGIDNFDSATSSLKITVDTNSPLGREPAPGSSSTGSPSTPAQPPRPPTPVLSSNTYQFDSLTDIAPKLSAPSRAPTAPSQFDRSGGGEKLISLDSLTDISPNVVKKQIFGMHSQSEDILDQFNSLTDIPFRKVQENIYSDTSVMKAY